ncbi:hypothetical protein NGA_0179202 [Nannochloropsis gaditana CCMP526]|uniref:uncharacterized protein n=1 Tax=Nannochloropsis gaditana (strain CCMP526) TaxID=1093141 RepID=UPI00029F5312|nr:hypothetical protein NGA_0179202 [Nannochloropsis gaditana CCMP526]EKU22912.1 hypothetical protein NGA_0179202 [Nannochloropsis gaditana CCMP526]|eukprot:XP_005853446.1 hypothetical protein NGA_0179202 [Nannochloropsis gaditana CCMP526]
MYNRSLHRSLALAASVTVTGAFAARVYRQQEEEEEAGRPASLQHHHNSLLLQSPAPLTKHIHEPVPCLPSFFLSPRPPAACAAAPAPGLPAGIPEFHQVPQPATDPADTDSIVFRMQKYFTTASLEEVAKFKKEKAGVKIYTVKEGSIPDPAIGGRKTGLPVARIGEAVINAPLEQVATLWWVFNGRILWDKVNTLASEVVEEYKNARLVYIKGTPKPMISSRDFVFVSHKVPAGDLGGSFGAQAFVQTNAANTLPENSGAVRGNINSIILLEPVDGYTTRVRYVCEIEPKGWLPTMAVEAAADDLPGVLGVMKAHLESEATGGKEGRRRGRADSRV